MKKSTEQDLVRQVLQLLKLRGVLCWRQNQGAARYRSESGRSRFVRFSSMPGIADVLAVLPGGRFLACEVKIGRNQTTPEQAAFLAAVRSAGGVAAVIRDVRELDALLAQLHQDRAGHALTAEIDSGVTEDCSTAP
ncbi:MAG TPA: hypothetical protein VEL76_13275 [Gemmataceae bacterium]|nr:hypothetical protein [Gemmataceae bacterium]